ncbi:MAG: hypothetical protein HN576_06150 [Bacteriovoracaceae bacterium]|jgi:hypothetical protein|nr:hypothetical protein [Bacteriovoracaceae bacterium]
MKKLINILIDSSIQEKSKENIISCLKDHEFDNCINDNISENDILITNVVKEKLSAEHYTVFLTEDDKKIETNKKSDYAKIIQVSSNDIESLINFIILANEKKIISLSNEIQQDARSHLEKVLKAGNSYLNRIQKRIVLDNIDQEKLNIEIDEFLEIQRLIIRVSIDLSLYEKEIDFVQFIEKSVKHLKLIKEISIRNNEQLKVIVPISNDELILPFPDREMSYIYIRLYSNSDLDRSNFLLSRLYMEIENFQFQKSRISDVQAVNELWNSAFLNLPSPVALYNSNGELLLHNTLFTNLQIVPKDCINLKNGEKVDLNKSIYRVLKKEIQLNQDEFIIFFFSSDNRSKERGHISSEELGIISSSIAHELNNPIAGILASISLLELEDTLCEESILSIKEMKHSAKRCQELIKVFLGFSKTTPTKNVDASMYTSYKHAIELLRFRMIESQLRMEIEQVFEKEIFLANGNSSVRAMIFYLVLNEILTFYSQNNLISSEVKNIAKGTFKEESDSVVITFSINIEKATSILSSKLITHLLNLENLELRLNNNQLLITQNDMRLLL